MQSTEESTKEQTLKAYALSIRFLSFRPRSEKELRDKLTQKDINSQIIETVVARLQKENLLNDELFTKWWIEQRQDFKGMASFAIKRELKQKGIDPDIIDKVLNNEGDDVTTAKAVYEKNKRKFAKYTGREHFQKAAIYLQRKGFSYDIIKQILKEEE